MTTPFPQPCVRELAPGLGAMEFAIPNGVLLISTIEPGADLPWHAHREVQMGLCLAGEFTMKLRSQDVLLRPYTRAYCVASDESHAAQNLSEELAIGLDLKLRNSSSVTSIVELTAGMGPVHTTPEPIGVAAGPWFDLAHFIFPSSTSPAARKFVRGCFCRPGRRQQGTRSLLGGPQQPTSNAAAGALAAKTPDEFASSRTRHVLRSTKALTMGVITEGEFSITIDDKTSLCPRFSVFVVPPSSHSPANIHAHGHGSLITLSVVTESEPEQE